MLFYHCELHYTLPGACEPPYCPALDGSSIISISSIIGKKQNYYLLTHFLARLQKLKSQENFCYTYSIALSFLAFLQEYKSMLGERVTQLYALLKCLVLI